MPVADSAGWQVSLVIWAGANFIAAVPWILVLLRGRAADARVDLEVASTMAPDGSLSKTESVEDSSATAAVSDQKINVWRSFQFWGCQ
ncbi:transporter, MFS superfamily [Renibacterium salmoninarum ATCC 33209]|uniref:Transporter, MFS superfamily n=1 Tax=Renibacterium salmoninarum (strain ATCC 33209 / DSM 20767 / JCM 11484 / NBRC 15589 / NCIMB 2235) TaxID=288705 RepID=A9WQ14_RENSM|nr:transporter, MFS superfamily [Renibacterium salmoninarum ATCC 33209]